MDVGNYTIKRGRIIPKKSGLREYMVINVRAFSVGPVCSNGTPAYVRKAVRR